MREALDVLWNEVERAGEIMGDLRAENEDLYKFEEMMKKGGRLPAETAGR